MWTSFVEIVPTSWWSVLPVQLHPAAVVGSCDPALEPECERDYSHVHPDIRQNRDRHDEASYQQSDAQDGRLDFRSNCPPT